MQNRFLEKGLGTFLTRGQLLCATDQWVQCTGGIHVAWVRAGVATGVTDVWARGADVEKNRKKAVRARGIEPATFWRELWSLTTGPAARLRLDLDLAEEEVRLGR